MASRTHYRIIVTFTYSNGQTGGVLDTTANSWKAVDYQLEANCEWLLIKGHTITGVSVQPINKES
jgi:hypothetical protein